MDLKTDSDNVRGGYCRSNCLDPTFPSIKIKFSPFSASFTLKCARTQHTSCLDSLNSGCSYGLQAEIEPLLENLNLSYFAQNRTSTTRLEYEIIFFWTKQF